MAVTASLVVKFGSNNEDGYLLAELDEERNNGSSGPFYFGTSFFFRVWSNVPYTISTTSGIVRAEGLYITSKDLKEELIFVESVEASVRYPIYRLKESKWFGGYGSLNYTGQKVFVDKDSGFLGVCHITYTTKYDLWRFTSDATLTGENYSAVILIKQTENMVSAVA